MYCTELDFLPRYHRENMMLKDTRMKTMNEVLDGVKVLCSTKQVIPTFCT